MKITTVTIIDVAQDEVVVINFPTGMQIRADSEKGIRVSSFPDATSYLLSSRGDNVTLNPSAVV